MPQEHIEIMRVPLPCGVCGRPTTQRHTLLDMPYCGRDGDAAVRRIEAVEEEGFGPAVRAGRRWWRRREDREQRLALAR